MTIRSYMDAAIRAGDLALSRRCFSLVFQNPSDRIHDNTFIQYIALF